jgi:hypothetical protein
MKAFRGAASTGPAEPWRRWRKLMKTFRGAASTGMVELRQSNDRLLDRCSIQSECMTSIAEVLDHIKRAPYAEDLRDLFGPTLFEQPVLAVNEALFAIVRYQLEESSFHPYDSKYDAYLAGKAKLSEAEARGLRLFEDPLKGNCASCHIDKPSRGGRPPTFTDYQFEALGAPRNHDIPANSDQNHYDLGLCGPLRKDFADTTTYCGLFKTPWRLFTTASTALSFTVTSAPCRGPSRWCTSSVRCSAFRW